MPRKLFETSRETRALVDLFRSLRYSETVSFAEASKRLGFAVTSTTPAYQSAKKIAERDHGVFIFSVRGEGFGRGTGADMVASAHPLFGRARRAMRTCADRLTIAFSENLTEHEHRLATEMYGRANLIAATASNVKAISNAKRADGGARADPFDVAEAIRAIKPRPKG